MPPSTENTREESAPPMPDAVTYEASIVAPIAVTGEAVAEGRLVIVEAAQVPAEVVATAADIPTFTSAESAEATASLPPEPATDIVDTATTAPSAAETADPQAFAIESPVEPVPLVESDERDTTSVDAFLPASLATASVVEELSVAGPFENAWATGEESSTPRCVAEACSEASPTQARPPESRGSTTEISLCEPASQTPTTAIEVNAPVITEAATIAPRAIEAETFSPTVTVEAQEPATAPPASPSVDSSEERADERVVPLKSATVAPLPDEATTETSPQSSAAPAEIALPQPAQTPAGTTACEEPSIVSAAPSDIAPAPAAESPMPEHDDAPVSPVASEELPRLHPSLTIARFEPGADGPTESSLMPDSASRVKARKRRRQAEPPPVHAVEEFLDTMARQPLPTLVYDALRKSTHLDTPMEEVAQMLSAADELTARWLRLNDSPAAGAA